MIYYYLTKVFNTDIIFDMLLKEVDFYLKSILNINELKNIDYSLNGLQVGRLSDEVSKIAFSVDACMESFNAAVNTHADLLFVHHGLFWGKEKALTNQYYDKIKYLMDNKLAVYAAHLPLDLNKEIGNNYGIAQTLDLVNIEDFGLYQGIKIGVKGIFKKECNISAVLEKLGINKSECLSILPFGTDKIKSVGIISGGAAKDIQQAVDEDLDLYITGEISHQVYHLCLESKINMIAAGHYFTEIWGIKLLEQKIRKDLKIETVFIDIPTGL